MNRKGFTSLEYQIILLLIEALAVGVIPNLGNNNVEINNFINEIQLLMDDAKTNFVKLSLEPEFNGYIFESNINDESDINLETNYFMKMDEHGNFTDIVVWNKDFCYEAVLAKDKDLDGKIDIDYLAKPKQFDNIDKTTINKIDILKHHEEDSKENYCKSNEYVK